MHKNLSFLHALTSNREPLWSGLNSAGERCLHTTTGVGVNPDAAIQFNGQGMLGFSRHDGSNCHPSLREFRHIHAPIGKTRQSTYV